MAERKGKDYRLQGIITAVLFHALLLILFYFLIMTVPNPPLGTMGGGGSELTYGDPAGELDLSNLVASNTPTQPMPQEEVKEEKVEEEAPEDQEEIVEEESNNEEDVPVAVKPEEKKKTEPKPKVESNVKKEEEPKVDDRFTLPSKKSGSKKGDPNGNTDTPGQTGKGDGFGGGEGGGVGKGKGPGLGDGLAGWKFVGNPYPVDNSQESGVLVFRLYVNKRGIIEKVEVAKNQGINPTTLNIYRQHVKNTVRFEPPTGVNIPEYTIGTVTYDLSAR